jgi:hypothetical protein
LGGAYREADLVVHDHVDGPADAKVGDVGHLERLVHDALPGNGGVPVQQDGDDRPHVLGGVAAVVLLGPGLAHHERVDALQVGRVGHQAQMDLASVGIRAVHRRSQMVLDVPAHAPVLVVARELLGVLFDLVVTALELGEDEGHRLAHDVGQDVQPTPVGHSQHERVGAELAGAVDPVLEGGNDDLSAVQAEPLGGVELLRQKALKGVGEAQSLEDVLLLLGVVVVPAGVLDPFPDPVALVGAANVHVLDAERPAVGPLQLLEDLSERHLVRGRLRELFQVPLVPAGAVSAQHQPSVHVGVRESVELGPQEHGQVVKVGVVGGRSRRWTVREGLVVVQPERIELRRQVSVHLVGPDEVGHPERVGLDGGGMRRGGGAHKGVRPQFGLGRDGDGGGRVVGLVVRHSVVVVVKVGPPAGRDRRGVGHVLLVHGLGVHRRRPVQEGLDLFGRRQRRR